MEVYDKASNHFLRKEFPANLPIECSYTHIGMYLGAMIEMDLISSEFLDEYGSQAFRFIRREISPCLLSELWSGSLENSLFTVEGNLFTNYYYGGALYSKDYQELLARNLQSFYHVEDSWENFEIIYTKIKERYADWKKLLAN